MPIVLAVLAALTLFYEFALPSILDGALLSTGPRGARRRSRSWCSRRSACASACSCRSGSTGSRRSPTHGEEYVAWAWAVNGFFSVIGSVLTTILSMAVGFRAVQFAALAIYAIAVVAFTRLPDARPTVDVVSLDDEPQAQAVTV